MKVDPIVPDGGAPTHPNNNGAAGAGGYTPEQTRQVLQFVTAQADTLRSLLTYLAQDVKDSRAQYQLHAAESIASMIAGASDAALGGVYMGGFEEWLYGQDFGKAGAA